MLAFLGVYLVALTIVILVVIVRDAQAERCPLFSTRNFFLLGIINFQTISGALTCFTGESERGAFLSDFTFPAAAFCVIITVFIAAFLYCYRKEGFVARIADRSWCQRVSTKTSLSIAGVVMVAIGITLRFIAGGVPWVGVLLPQIAAGCLCAGVGLVAIAWVRSSFNPLTALLLFGALAASSAALLIDAFGRREILGLCFAVAWALYFEKWRTMAVPKLVLRIAIAFVLTLIPFLVFSAARTSGGEKRTLAEQVQGMMQIDAFAVDEVAMQALSGQFAGGISMWIYHTRPSAFPIDPLHSLVYFVTLPIPRDLWPGKPEGLGLTVVHQAAVSGVSAIHSWGPGLVGHIWNDFVYLSLPIYAFLLAGMCRYMDQRMIGATRDPLTVVLFGSALGQLLGMPRGDLGLFVFNMLAAYLGVWIFIRLGVGLFLPKDRTEYVEDDEGDEQFDETDDGESPIDNVRSTA